MKLFVYGLIAKKFKPNVPHYRGRYGKKLKNWLENKKSYRENTKLKILEKKSDFFDV